LVYAFASFLFFAGILGKEKPMIAISLLVIFLYGGMIWGVLPGKVNISWESHLFGFLAGFIVAFYIGRPAPTIKVENKPSCSKDFNEVNSTVDKYFHIFYSYRENQD
jgi:membrane associated rhomboid family serine protease